MVDTVFLSFQWTDGKVDAKTLLSLPLPLSLSLWHVASVNYLKILSNVKQAIKWELLGLAELNSIVFVDNSWCLNKKLFAWMDTLTYPICGCSRWETIRSSLLVCVSGPDMLCKYTRQLSGFSSPEYKSASVDHTSIYRARQEQLEHTHSCRLLWYSETTFVNSLFFWLITIECIKFSTLNLSRKVFGETTTTTFFPGFEAKIPCSKITVTGQTRGQGPS